MNQKNTMGSFPPFYPETTLIQMNFSSPDAFRVDLTTLCQTLNDVFFQLKKTILMLEDRLNHTTNDCQKQPIIVAQMAYKKVLLDYQKQLLKQMVDDLPVLWGEKA